jgi:ATP/maltotriose-dependent transcriptional regulator MalT
MAFERAITAKMPPHTAILSRIYSSFAVRRSKNDRGVYDEILSDLSENHYFTERYSEDPPVYRYHPLFREFLISRAETLMKPEQIVSIQKRAAVLLEESGQAEEAVRIGIEGNAKPEIQTINTNNL